MCTHHLMFANCEKNFIWTNEPWNVFTGNKHIYQMLAFSSFANNIMFTICLFYKYVFWLHFHKSNSTMSFKLYYMKNFTTDETNQYNVGDKCSLVGKDIEQTTMSQSWSLSSNLFRILQPPTLLCAKSSHFKNTLDWKFFLLVISNQTSNSTTNER